MCVAIIVRSEKGPLLSDMETMERQNSDGAGVAWLGDDGMVHWEKGIKAKRVRELLDLLPRPCLVHFRYATHGTKRPLLTHPFPLGDDAWEHGLEGSSDAVLIHNGTWSKYRDHLPDSHKKVDCSDTQVAAWVAGYWEEILDEVSWATAVARAVKVVTVEESGRESSAFRLDVTKRGRWYDEAGDEYSNLSWKRTSYTSTYEYGRSYSYYDGKPYTSPSGGTYYQCADGNWRCHLPDGSLAYPTCDEEKRNHPCVARVAREKASDKATRGGLFSDVESRRGCGVTHPKDSKLTCGGFRFHAEWCPRFEPIVRTTHLLPPGRPSAKRETKRERKERKARERTSAIAARARRVAGFVGSGEAADTQPMRAVAEGYAEPPWVSERTRAIASDSSAEMRVITGEAGGDASDDPVSAYLDADRAAIEEALADTDLGDVSEEEAREIAEWLEEYGGDEG